MNAGTVLGVVLLAASTACRSAPRPIGRSSADGPVDASVGVPAEWLPWMGFDEWETPPPVDWREVLTAEGMKSGAITKSVPSDACIFELVHREGTRLRRWHVLVRAAWAGPVFRQLILSLPEREGVEARRISIPVPFRPVTVSVAPEGQAVGPARDARLPAASPGRDYTVGADGALDEAFLELRNAGGETLEVQDRYCIVLMKPLTLLFAVLQGIQEHAELYAILREVVDAPGFLGILLAGGLEIRISADMEGSGAFDFPVGESRTRAGVRFPATLVVNGDPALEMEIFALPAAAPVHLTGGLVGLRAWTPGDDESSVEIRMVGARRVAEGIARTERPGRP